MAHDTRIEIEVSGEIRKYLPMMSLIVIGLISLIIIT